MSDVHREVADNIPAAGAGALQEFMTAACFDPWSLVPPGGGNMPTLEFGPGRQGLVTFLIDDEHRELLITQVLWLG